MYSNVSQQEKMSATHFLENFQKSQEAWEIVLHVLNDRSFSSNLQLLVFAAQTLRSKVIYDLSSQLGVDNYEMFKGKLLEIVGKYDSANEKLIRVQLSIALSQFCLQYLNWRNPIDEIFQVLGNGEDEKKIVVLLDFLRILPEELSDIKKTNLSDEEFNKRTSELITDNVAKVLIFLKHLTEMSKSNNSNVYLNGLILDCLNSWIKECPIEDVLKINSLVELIFTSLTNDEIFDKGIECLVSIIRETRDVENYEIIDALYQQILQLNNFMKSKGEDMELVDGLTRLYVECGESWNVLIGKNPDHFKPLVQIILECTKYDDDLDIVKYTFPFWYQLKQLITLPKFEQSKRIFSDIYLELISVIIKHLTYPIGNNDNDLFNGDKEQEDKFKEFRYEMGDVLKDCCAVTGATKALQVPFEQIQKIISNSQGHWQYLEAPLFSMRTMAKEVPLKENTILPTIMSYLVQLPEHPKIRYAATLVLGRYTEWTSKHPDFLEPQLNYITKGFEIGDKNHNNEIIMATSHSLMYFCQDCSELLVNYLEQLYNLYGQVKGQMDIESNYELADGLAHVIRRVPQDNLYQTTNMFIEPTIQIIVDKINGNFTGDQADEKFIADQVEILSIFIEVLKCPESGWKNESYPIANLFIDKIWPLIKELLNKFGKSLIISERCMKLLKNGIKSLSVFLVGILPDLVNLLHEGFQKTQFGCYLWVTGILIREFGDADEYLPNKEIKNAIYEFGLQQCLIVFKMLSSGGGGASQESIELQLKRIPDVIEDYFRMINDLLMFYPFQLIPNFEILNQIFHSVKLTLNYINEFDPIISCIHFMIDLISWGLENPPISLFEFEGDTDKLKLAIQQFLLINNQGKELLEVLINGVIFKFHNDILQDTNDLILKILVVIPDKGLVISWLNEIISKLPNVNQEEINKLINTITVALPNKDNRRVRSGLRDFISWYTRKNIKPRSEFQ
ncbi:putative importin Mtr10p [Candida maltosa Xu316]|uniref:Putative importin Mtr10p n=1 Tax=Candida maltosa (strain Xu316) TaxID=1245528 RepID=M3HGR2_CANMX|nr:putative importin Mtr10p [Candida maltosa Xu316]